MVSLILASRSAARRVILEGAAVPFTAEDARVDEDAIKTARTDLDPMGLALELAKAKALAVSERWPDAFVLGSDQTLDVDGATLSKAASLEEARGRLLDLRGREHRLHSGVALAKGRAVVWSTMDSARLTMRDFSEAFLDTYLASEGPAALSSVGTYRLEGPGAQLFERIEGDYFTVLGLPLWPVLAELRRLGVLAS